VTISGEAEERALYTERRPFPINWLLLVAAGGFIVGVIILFIGPNTSVALTNTNTLAVATQSLSCNSPFGDWVGTPERYLGPPATAVHIYGGRALKVYEQDAGDVASACSRATRGRGHLALTFVGLSLVVAATAWRLQISRRLRRAVKVVEAHGPYHLLK